jgi:hypothetical protein
MALKDTKKLSTLFCNFVTYLKLMNSVFPVSAAAFFVAHVLMSFFAM